MNELTDCSEGKNFLCEYRYKGETWTLEIKAESHEDAEQRLMQVSRGKVLGEIKATLPYQLGWLARFWVWVNQG